MGALIVRVGLAYNICPRLLVKSGTTRLFVIRGIKE